MKTPLQNNLIQRTFNGLISAMQTLVGDRTLAYTEPLPGIELPEQLPTLTDKQTAVLVFIVEHYIKIKDWPTYSEMTEGLPLSRSTIAHIVSKLVEKKYVIKSDGLHSRKTKVTSLGMQKLDHDGVLPEVQGKLSFGDVNGEGAR